MSFMFREAEDMVEQGRKGAEHQPGPLLALLPPNTSMVEVVAPGKQS